MNRRLYRTLVSGRSAYALIFVISVWSGLVCGQVPLDFDDKGLDEHVQSAVVSVQTVGFDDPNDMACRVSYEFARYDVFFSQLPSVLRRTLNMPRNAASSRANHTSDSPAAFSVLATEDPFAGFGLTRLICGTHVFESHPFPSGLTPAASQDQPGLQSSSLPWFLLTATDAIDSNSPWHPASEALRIARYRYPIVHYAVFMNLLTLNGNHRRSIKRMSPNTLTFALLLSFSSTCNPSASTASTNAQLADVASSVTFTNIVTRGDRLDQCELHVLHEEEQTFLPSGYLSTKQHSALEQSQPLTGVIRFKKLALNSALWQRSASTTRPADPLRQPSALEATRLDRLRKMLRLGLGAAMDGYVDCVSYHST